MVGGGSNVVLCFICGHVFGCCKCLWRCCLGMRFRDGFLVGVRCLDVADVGGLGCEFLILLDAKVISIYGS